MRIFKTHIQRIAPDTNYIVGGDFNTMPIHPIINRLGRLLDLRTGNLFSPTWKYNGRKSTIARANIDYVATLLGSRLSISELQVLDRYPSDHAPLLATICMLAQDPTR